MKKGIFLTEQRKKGLIFSVIVLLCLIFVELMLGFNVGRFVIETILVLIFGALSFFGLWQISFDPENKNHKISAVLLCLTCVLIAVLLSSALCPKRESIAYPFENSVASYNPYEQQFDAFMKGQLNIDVKPSEELLKLENPYDPYQREGIYYLWDRAYYDGSYYSYFGIAPILTVYYPYYLINRSLPSVDTVSAIFTVMTALFFALSAVKLLSVMSKRVPLPLVWILTLGGLFATQVFLVMRGNARFYYIAISSGMAFLSAFVWLLLCAISGNFGLSGKKTDKKRHLALVLSGVMYGLCFLSRLNMALFGAFLVIPLLWFFVLRENVDGKGRFRPLKKIIVDLLCIGTPVILAFAGQLIFNYLRFDSFLEFGTNYQLTVSDISKNKLRLPDLGYAIFHYFLQPISFAENFPLPSLLYTRLEEYGHFVYVDTGMGLFTNPFFWLLFGGIFVVFDKTFDKRRGNAEKITYSSVILGAVAVALMNFCLGGVIFRYTCDLTLLLSLAAIGVTFSLCDRKEKVGGEASVAMGVNFAVTAMAVLGIFVAIGLAFSQNVNLTEYPTTTYEFFRNLFI